MDFEDDFASMIKLQKPTACWIEKGGGGGISFQNPPAETTAWAQEKTDALVCCVATFSI